MPEDDEDTAAIAEDGRLHRGEDMSESDALQAIQAAMTKADSQMEDSVMASYFGILLGCLIQRDTVSFYLFIFNFKTLFSAKCHESSGYDAKQKFYAIN